MTESRIAAVVVTYNRKELLQECVEALLLQQVAGGRFRIFVIDNASTDGTREAVQLFLDRYAQTVSYRALPENLGGAGGFYYGMKWAVEEGFDYVWIMDDDTIPRPDALKCLLRGMESHGGETVGFVSSTVLWTDGTPCIMNGQQYADEALGRVVSATFVSLLFPSDVIRRVGLPLKEYFIWGDDKEYTLRISDRYPCYHVRDSVVVHKMQTNAGSSIARDDRQRVPRYYYAYRNDLATAKTRGTGAVLVYYAAFILNVCRVLICSRDAKGERISAMYRGWKAGRKFRPQIAFPDGKRA